MRDTVRTYAGLTLTLGFAHLYLFWRDAHPVDGVTSVTLFIMSLPGWIWLVKKS